MAKLRCRDTYWQVCLPATGIVVTACLYALVNGLLLANTAPTDPLNLKVRVFDCSFRDYLHDFRRREMSRRAVG
jgi:hypothetical protein